MNTPQSCSLSSSDVLYYDITYRTPLRSLASTSWTLGVICTRRVCACEVADPLQRDVSGSEFSGEPTIGLRSITIHLVISIYKLPDGSRAGEMIAVNYFIPYYVNDVQSDIRGIRCGWYTMDECGTLGYGPFSTASECLGIGSQAKKAETPKWLH
jgi:hypothetical protein